MHGGGRRSPPHLRSRGGDALQSLDSTPPKPNMGFCAVLRGPHGRFVSPNPDGISAGGNGEEELLDALKDEGAFPHKEASMDDGAARLEDEAMEDSLTPDGMVAASVQQQVATINGDEEARLMGIRPNDGDALAIVDGYSPSSPPIEVSAGQKRLVEEANAMNGVCQKAAMSCVPGVPHIRPINFMDVGSACVNNNDAMDSSFPCNDLGNNDVEVGGNIMVINGVGQHSPSFCMQDVRRNSFEGKQFTAAPKTAWSKPGVVAVPSPEDVKHLSAIDGVVQLDHDEVNTFYQMFQTALVGRLFGKHIPYLHLFSELKRRWDSFGHFRLITLSNECFMCIFDSTEARDGILRGGPWMVSGQVIGLDVWSPGFSAATLHGFFTPVWVRFPGLPLYCWGSKSLTSIASRIGVPVWIDEATHKMGRGSFARLCIKVDLSKQLLPSIKIQGPEGVFVQQIEYEGLTSFCHICGMVGHKVMSCPNKGATQRAAATTQPPNPSLSSSGGSGKSPSSQAATLASGDATAAHPPTPHSSSPADIPPRDTAHIDADSLGDGGWKIVQPRWKNRRRPSSTTADRGAAHVPPKLKSKGVHPGMEGRHSIFRFEASTSTARRPGTTTTPKGRKSREVTHKGKAIFAPHVGTPLDVQEPPKKRKSLVRSADEDASSFMPP